MLLTMASTDVTTVKVSKRLRERISTRAAERNQTVHDFLEHILDDYERHLRIDSVATAMAAADDTALDEWRAESDAWAGANADLDSAS